MHREAETCLQDFHTDISKDICNNDLMTVWGYTREIYAGAREGRSGFASALS